jgi:hypothetical protein
MALVWAGCGAPTAPPPAATMLGAWNYNSGLGVDRPSLNAGLHVTLTVDSVAGMACFGRVTRWLAGDVGIGPGAFGPLTGSVDVLGAVNLRIPWAGPDLPALTVIGVLDGDLLTVSESWFGTAPGPFPAGSLFERAR